jgi:acyl-CoA synthetase (NDP forming)
VAKNEDYTKAEQQWIAETRLRLAQRRGKKPATKSGQIRALWPEIQAAIADGQSLASIRQWLEEEGGVVVTVQSLGSYLTRIRRKEQAKAISPTQPASKPTLSESKLRSPALHSPDNLRESTKKKRGFEYPPGPPDESKLI